MFIAITDAILIWKGIDRPVIVAGAVTGGLAVLHLLLNFSLGGAWPPLPLKEVTVGSLFALGTLVPLYPVQSGRTTMMTIALLAFAILCAFNCTAIAFWERELDEAQNKVSFATRFPRLHRWFIPVLLIFSSLALIGAISLAAPVLGCVSLSAFLLAVLDFFGEKIERDQRTALADLVLLTPLIVGLVMNP